MSTNCPDSDPDSTAETTERAISAIYEEMDSQRVTLAVVAVTCFTAFGIQRLLEYCSRVHLGLAALLSAVIALGFIWFSRIATRPPLASTRSLCAAYLSLGLMLAVVVAGWASYAMHSRQVGEYTVASAPSLDVFIRLYFFTLADLIPVIKITETLHLKSPVEARDFAAGLPVLAFRGFVLWFLFDVFQTWRKSRKDAEGRKRATSGCLWCSFWSLSLQCCQI